MLLRKKIIIGLSSSKNFLQIVCFHFSGRKAYFICAEEVAYNNQQVSDNVKQLFKQAEIICCSLEVHKEIFEKLHLSKKNLASFLAADFQAFLPFDITQAVCEVSKTDNPTAHVFLKKDLKEYLKKIAALNNPIDFLFSPSRSLHQFLNHSYNYSGFALYIEEDRAAAIGVNGDELIYFQGFQFDNIFSFKQKLKSIKEEIEETSWLILGPESKQEGFTQVLQDLHIQRVQQKPKFFDKVISSRFCLAIGSVWEYFAKGKKLYFNRNEFVDPAIKKRLKKRLAKFAFSFALCILFGFGFVNSVLMRHEQQIIKSIHVAMGDDALMPSKASFWSNLPLFEKIIELKTLDRKLKLKTVGLMPTPIHIFGLIGLNSSVQKFEYRREKEKITFLLDGIQKKQLETKALKNNFRNVHIVIKEGENGTEGEIAVND